MFSEGVGWKDMSALECATCQHERRARDRVVHDVSDPRLQHAPFDAAPCIHPNNLPKYCTLQQRAVEYAKQRQLCIHWVVAVDRPLHQDDLALPEEALNKKRQRWLGFHDRKTGRCFFI